jgi:hypothetical protein
MDDPVQHAFVFQCSQFLSVSADRSCPRPSSGDTFARRHPIAVTRRRRTPARDRRVRGPGLWLREASTHCRFPRSGRSQGVNRRIALTHAGYEDCSGLVACEGEVGRAC